MRRHRENREPAIFDGEVRVEPMQWISLWSDLPANPSVADLTGWMRAYRGKVLSKTFELESDLIFLALDAEFFGSTDPEVAYRRSEREMSYREEHSFDRKIDRAKPIAREKYTKERADRLIQDLSNCRIVRNLMAHYPCWLEPINDDENRRTTGFKLFIADRKHVWHIEQRDVEEWDRLFLESRREIIRLRFAIYGRAEPDFVPGGASLVGDEPNEDGTGVTSDIPGIETALRR